MACKGIRGVDILILSGELFVKLVSMFIESVG